MRAAARLLPLIALVAVGPAHAPQVAFRQAGDRYDVVVTDESGGNAVRVTAGKPELGVSGTFSWAPDGSRLVYAAESPTAFGGDLYTVAPDGSGLAQLTSGGGNRAPAWSPDGKSIAYVHGTSRDMDVWLVSPDGAGARRLTHDDTSVGDVAWSPDGSRLLVAEKQLEIVDAGSGRLLLRPGGFSGAWSPDGSKLAVATTRSIAVVDADGGNRHTVAEDGGDPQWSPDGTQIAFSRSHCTPGVKGLCGAILDSVYVVGADGRGERRLTGPVSGGAGALFDGFPADGSSLPRWWPDGRQLFFHSGGDDAERVMNADGTCERPFTWLRQLWDPQWRPGADPTTPPARCADLRVRAQGEHDQYGVRGDAKVDVVVENDGNETASGVTLALSFEYGRGTIRPPLAACSGAPPTCPLPPLAPGGSQHLTVRVKADPSTVVFHLAARATEREQDLDAGNNAALAFVGVRADCDLVGTAGDDLLVGTPGRDRICALPGADTVRAGAGDDRIDAGAGDDRVYPGPGRDVVDGGEGRDTIYARDGQRDVIDCGPYRDTVYADRVDVLRHCERVIYPRR